MSRTTVVPLALALLACCALGDYATGVDVTFTLLYLAPVALGAWYRGRRFGFALATLATLSSLATSLARPSASARPHVVIWNEVGVLVVFLVIVQVMSLLHEALDREKRERRSAVDQLRHADRLNVIGKLAAGFAHEIGTPLNVISGSAELIQGGRLTPEKRDHLLEGIVKQTQRISLIVRQLLDFGRRAATTTARVDVSAIVEATAAMLAPMAKKGSTRLEVTAAEGPLFVDANASEIEQVLSNLVINALHAMPGGGVLRMAASREPKHACLVVEDEGSGITKENLPHIFDPFFTTKDVGAGTGLGLSVSYGIVQDHGGHIDVRSEVGKGTRFEIRLPLAA